MLSRNQEPPKGVPAPGSVKRFGEILVENGHLQPEQVEEALRAQESRPNVPLGQVCVDLGFLTRAQLDYLLNRYGKRPPIGEMLLNAGLITQEALTEARNLQKCKGGRLGEILVGLGHLKEVDLCGMLARQFNIPFVSLRELEPAGELKTYVNAVYAARNSLVPIALKGGRLTVATSDPARPGCVEDLAGMTRLEVEEVLATASDVAQTYRRLYGNDPIGALEARSQSQRMGPARPDGKQDAEVSLVLEPTDIFTSRPALVNGQALRPEGGFAGGTGDAAAQPASGSQAFKTEETVGLEVVEEEELEFSRSRYVVSVEDSPVVQTMVQTIIGRALALKVSDIHFEINLSGPRLRLRVDGMLRDHHLGPVHEEFRNSYRSVISRMKILAHMDVAERRHPQEGTFRMLARRAGQPTPVDLRVTTFPGRFGEGMTVHVLDHLRAPQSLAGLGLSRDVLDGFRSLIQQTAGIILVTGPGGSGRSSTLYAALRSLYRPELKIFTAEDPIEFTHPGICQAEVNPAIGNTFASYLRSFLRQDPDVIMIGEIQDAETAEMVLRAAQTGHLILSTLHTNTATASVHRLCELVTDRNSLATNLIGVMAQRLVRKVCEGCAQPYVPEGAVLQEWFERPPVGANWSHGKGCDGCDGTGYAGRMAVAELWIPSAKEAMMINRGASPDELRAEALKRTPSLAEDALLKVLQGTTTLEEALRVVPYEEVAWVKRNGLQRVQEMLGEPQADEEQEAVAERKAA